MINKVYSEKINNKSIIFKIIIKGLWSFYAFYFLTQPSIYEVLFKNESNYAKLRAIFPLSYEYIVICLFIIVLICYFQKVRSLKKYFVFSIITELFEKYQTISEERKEVVSATINMLSMIENRKEKVG